MDALDEQEQLAFRESAVSTCQRVLRGLGRPPIASTIPGGAQLKLEAKS